MKKLKQLLILSVFGFSTAALSCQMNDIQYAIRSIRNYLVERPHAADTVIGIHTYWINWPDEIPAVTCTFVALTHLEGEGEMESIRISDQEIWRRKN